MTDFIESFATHQVLPPWTSARVMTWAFVIRLEEPLIRAHLDRYFNGAYPDRAPFYYSPLPGPDPAKPGPQFGLLVIAWHPLLWSEYPGNPPGWDSVSVTEVYLGIPVERRPISADNIVIDDPTLVWVQPFMFGDNASVVFGSREIWGTDMEYATIVRDEPGPGKLHLDVGIEAIEYFRPTSVSRLLSCLHVRTNGFTKAGLDQIVAGSPDLGPFLQILVTLGIFTGHDPAPPDPNSVAGGAEINNLKQFRDVHDMGAAIYRAIVASQTTHVNVDKLNFYDCEQVEIDFMWSDSVSEMLKGIFGISGPSEAGPPHEHLGPALARHTPMPLAGSARDIDWNLSRVPVTAELGFEMRSDVSFTVLRTLHTYGVSAPAPSSARRRTSAFRS
jgi:hypothetical protein